MIETPCPWVCHVCRATCPHGETKCPICGTPKGMKYAVCPRCRKVVPEGTHSCTAAGPPEVPGPLADALTALARLSEGLASFQVALEDAGRALAHLRESLALLPLEEPEDGHVSQTESNQGKSDDTDPMSS